MTEPRAPLADVIESLRNATQADPVPRRLQMEELLAEAPFRVGTVRRWNGVDFQKQRDGQWTKVPTGKRSGSAPTAPAAPVALKKAALSVAAAALAKKALGAPAAAPAAKKATPDNLPDDPYKYFKKTPDSKLIPLAAVKTIRARPEGIKNAAVHMANAFNGEGEKRKPLSLKDNGDGTYTVMDGNSTTAMARAAKWKNIVATVAPADSKDDGAHDSPKKDEPKAAASSVGDSIPGLADAVKSGKLGSKTVEEHVAIGEKFLGEHAKNLSKSLSRLEGLMPEGVKVKGRVKTLESALGKLVRKPKYGTVDKLQDGTGMRVIAKDTAVLEKSIAALKKNYKVVAEDDYISKPLGGETGLGYRSYHAIIEDEDGLQKEVQLRTPNQNTHADWCHDVYKPVNAEQERAMKENADEIAKYARDMGDFFEKVDKAEKPGSQPPCPPPVKQYFTCL